MTLATLENMVSRFDINSSAHIGKKANYQKSRHARPDMVKELHLGANVLLAHFHYGCKGYHPFDLDWNPELSTSMASLDDEQIRIIRQTAHCVDYNGNIFGPRLIDVSIY